MALQYDEFNDGVLAGFWETTNPPDGERYGHAYKEYLAAGGSMQLHQQVSASHDFWARIDIGTYIVGLSNSVGTYFGWYDPETYDPPPGQYYGAIYLSCFWSKGGGFDVPVGEKLFISLYADVWGNGYAPFSAFEGANIIADADAEGLAIDAIYLRQKWDADTKTTRFFWSLTEPTFDDDWTELVWDAPAETFDVANTTWFDPPLDSWDSMRAVLRTLDFSQTSPVGMNLWMNSEFVPNLQKVFYFRSWPPEPDLYPRIGALENLAYSLAESLELLATKDELGQATDALESDLETLDTEFDTVDSQVKVLQDFHT
ncbi:MAG: hypothetical protein KAR39_11665 [Thermoplasmata archaeon]|nr:hypothetical protein [Thermoplasmata archaeon]